MIYVIILLMLVSFFCMAGFYKKKEQALEKQEQTLRELRAAWPSPEGHRRRVETALKGLNCQFEWKEDKETGTVLFDYQGGHFTLRVGKQSPYATLFYLYAHQSKLSELDLVRQVINNCNINTENCHLVYTIDEEKSVVDIHIINNLLLGEGNAREVLKRGMEEVFVWQRQSDRSLNAAKQDTAEEGDDPELSRAQRNHEYQLLTEQEMAHQEGGDGLRSGEGETLTLGGLLDKCVGLHDLTPIRLLIVRDSQTEVRTDSGTLLAAPLSTVLIDENGAWRAQHGNMTLYYRDARNPSQDRHLSVDFEQQDIADDTLYYRCTISLIPCMPSPISATHDDDRAARIVSVVVGHDIKPSNHQQQLRYLYKEAMAKVAAGETEELTDDERLLTSFSTPYYGQAALRGRQLYNEGRYLESARLLENVYRGTQHMFSQMTKTTRGMFFAICHLIGACYMQFQQWERACFYLELTLPARQYGFIQMYVNCLVNSHDFRALGQIEAYLQEVQATMDEEHYDDDSEEMSDMVAFSTFLYRRKAYVLAENERYEEAEKLLKKLIDDPVSNSFALKELAYVQRKLGEKAAKGAAETTDQQTEA